MTRRSPIAISLFLLLVVVGLLTVSCGSNATTAPEEDAPAIAATVHIKDGEFDPREIDIEVGGSVMWINDDVASHDLQFIAPNKISSGVIRPKGVWTRTFGSAGTYLYYCDFHNTMKGSVVVRPAP